MISQTQRLIQALDKLQVESQHVIQITFLCKIYYEEVRDRHLKQHFRDTLWQHEL